MDVASASTTVPTTPATTADAVPQGRLKERLLRAAVDSLRDLTPENLLNAVGVRDIARRAGGSPASIYHHYGSLEGLATAVVDHIYDPVLAPVEGLIEGINSIKDTQLPLETAFGYHGADLDRLTNDVDYPLRMGLWAFGGTQAADAYRTYLRTIDDHLGPVVEAMIESWSRELRPPFDIAGYVATRVAMLNGSVLRHRLEPETLTRTRYQRAATTLDLILLRVVGDNHDTDSRLAEINYYPQTPVAPSVPTTAKGRAVNARILNAAATLFNTRGYDDTTFERVASIADTNPSTLKRYYPTKHHLATALFTQQVTDALLNTSNSQAPNHQDPRTALHGHLTALAAFVPPRSAQATEYLSEVFTTPEYTDTLIERTHAALADLHPVTASDTNDLEPDPYEPARLLVGLTIRSALRAPAAPAETHAAKAINTVALNGLQGRQQPTAKWD